MVKTCKLYRTVYDLIHPSISRKNITDYQIILDEGILPIQVFYPKVGVELKKIILYLPGEKQDISFYEELANQMNSMVFLIEFVESDRNQIYKKTVQYIWNQLKEYSLEKNLSFIADGLRCHILQEIEEISVSKKVLILPIELPKKELENSIVITNQKKMKNTNSYYSTLEFSHIMEEDSLADRESVFSIVREFIV